MARRESEIAAGLIGVAALLICFLALSLPSSRAQAAEKIRISVSGS
jgi:hypothetical protein